MNKTLYIIPARGGSKGIPHKNIKLFCGKPLISYSIDIARKFVTDEHICVSTDDDKIIEVVEKFNLLKVPFKRPKELATDTVSTNDVLIHAINFYESKGIFYDNIVLLQPTSPLRTFQHIKEAILLYTEDLDAVMSVRESHTATVLCEEDKLGYLRSIFNTNNSRRQDVKSFYEYNGAIYVINTKSLKEKGLSNFEKKKKYLMPMGNSIDIDTMLDWKLAEMIFKNEF